MAVIPTSESPSAGAALDQWSLERLLRAVRDLAGCRDLAAIVEVVRHAARELVSADGATFVLRDDDMCYYVDEDAIEPLWRGQRFPLQACVSGWAMLHHEQVVIPDIYQDDRVPHDAYRPTFVRSLVMTPIRSAAPVGSIGTYWAEHREASQAELELLQALADSTAVAIENAMTLEGLEAQVAARTAEVSASNRDLAAFAHRAAHDLKEPLTTIAGHAELIGDLPQIALDETAARSLGVVQRQARRMADLIDGVLRYSSVATEAINLVLVDLNALVTEVLQDLSGLAERRGAEIVVGPLPTAWCSRELTERVIQNLIANAINYAAENGPRVEIRGHAARGEVTLCVSDNGPGVPIEERSRIFDMFTRGTADSSSGGSGIGLAFARRAMARQGGEISVGDAELGGATFTIHFPVITGAK